MPLVTVARTSDIPQGEVRRVEVSGHEIAVANLGEEGFRAVGDVCSHAQAYLHEGEVDTDFMTIECPRHGSTFDLDTGRPKSLPATAPVPFYKVKVEDDEVKVEIDDD
jgi:3-phenylpropionate/trans-cinnamate dioxygenase ferredoxin component